jgi:hypothetical protein
MAQPQSRRTTSMAPRKPRPLGRSSSLSHDRTPGASIGSTGRTRKAVVSPPATAQQTQAPPSHRLVSRSARAPTRSASAASGNGQPRRRSNSTQRYPSVHVHTSQQQPSRQQNASHNHHHQPNHLVPSSKCQSVRGYYVEGLDTCSVASAPSLKNTRDREFREPSSTRSTGGKKLYREDSPASRKSSQADTPQKHVKTARKVIEGKSCFSGLIEYWTPCEFRSTMIVNQS